MTYEQILQYMFESLPMYQRIGKAAYKGDLENAYELDKFSGYPHKAYKTIHVAGTNGKGSVSHMLASILQKAGYKTGLYTSPHLLDFRERIRINGEMIDKKYIIKYIQRNQCFFELIKPSFFEMTVFMAFSYFKTEEVDVAIIETGLGGRLDTTNIITPIASVITNIGMDHEQFLGNTIKQIAKEKAGIIKPMVPVVIGESSNESKGVFHARCSLMESPLIQATEQYQFLSSHRTNRHTQRIQLRDSHANLAYETDLLGLYQYKNLVTCLTTLDVIADKFPVTNLQISEGLSTVMQTTGLLGRWQIIDSKPLTVCDVAHNKDGLKLTLDQVSKTNYEKLHMVIGFVNDKNLAEILPLFPKEAYYYFTRASIERAADPHEIMKLASTLGLKGKVYENVEVAWLDAQKHAEEEDFIYIGGSTFVVADFLTLQKK